VRPILHKVHLASLKANFELFLNRLLSIVGRFHFRDAMTTTPRDKRMRFRDLAEAGNSGLDDSDICEFIISKVVPEHGLGEFRKVLKRTTGIDLVAALHQKNTSDWPQIYTAFEVRHLVEHRNGRVDRKFLAEVDQKLWSQSSWGRGGSGLPMLLEKVPVEEEDVIKTYEAMLGATRLLTAEVLRWDSESANGSRSQYGTETK
jgi:hypothetical protein